MSTSRAHPDPTDTKTLRPDLDPLKRRARNFNHSNALNLTEKSTFLPNITPFDALGIFILFFPVPIVKTIVQNTNKYHETGP
jgi:hypothetical protein